MYVDSSLELSDGQAVTSTAISANVIDRATLGAAAGAAAGPNATVDIGPGGPLYLVVQTRTACTDVGSDATLTLTLESSATADLATSPTVHLSSGAIAFAGFAPAGTRVACIPVPSGQYKRYVGLRYTVNNGPLTAGAFDAFLTTNPGATRQYMGNFSVL